MTKYIANILTSCRILGSVLLLPFPVFSVAFYMIYLFCGLTDMIDGTIARKTGTVSEFGARLDTVSDFVFLCVCGIKMLPRIHPPVWLWVWITLIALTKIWTVVFFFIKKKKLLSNHSMLNKITGFALFLFPLTLTFLETTYSVATICVLATGAAMQEVYFTRKGQELIMKKHCFFENAKLLYDRFEIVPLMYGSLGLEYITNETLNADDIDILIPEVFISERWHEFKRFLIGEGYSMLDEHEHTFQKDTIAYSYAAIEELETFAKIRLSDIEQQDNHGINFKLLSLEQYLKVYRASAKDGYRITVRQKKDHDKIAFIGKRLKRRRDK